MEMSPFVRTPSDENGEAERVVLQEVLTLHPTHLTTAELILKVSGKPGEQRDMDLLRQAIEDLIAAGVLQTIGLVIAPTYPVLHADGLT